MAGATTRWVWSVKGGAGSAAVALVLGACASSHAGSAGAEPFPAATEAESVRVVVENLNPLDASLYLLREGSLPRRIGDVPGNGSSRSFDVPWADPLDMVFRIDLVAGGTCVTLPTMMGPGDALELRIVRDFTTADCR